MKITTPKRLDSSLFNEKVLDEFVHTGSISSSDGMRSDYTYDIHGKRLGIIKDETKNEDGTYTYEYSVRKYDDNNTELIIDPSESEYELNDMIEELLLRYKIHEFSTDLTEKPINIKDYYLDLDVKCVYDKDEEPKIGYCNRGVKSKESQNYKEPLRDSDVYIGYKQFIEKHLRSESMEEINKKINDSFSKDDNVMYLLGERVRKFYNIQLDLSNIEEEEIVTELVNKIEVNPPKYLTFESALESGEITIEDVRNLVLKCEDLEPNKVPVDILGQLFSEDPDLYSNFQVKKIPMDVLRKYVPNFDVFAIDPDNLIPSDLDKVLEGVVSSNIYNSKEKYLEYLQSFSNDPEALKKIIPVLVNHSNTFLFNSEDYIKNISPEVLGKDELRDLILDADNVKSYMILRYDLEYDKDSARKLLNILSNEGKETLGLDCIDNVFDIAQKNGIGNDELLQVLREFSFNISPSSIKNKEIEKFRKFGINGITIDDFRDVMLKQEDFSYFKLIENIQPEEVSREYNSILNELAEKRCKKNGEKSKMHNEIFNLMCNYLNPSELFSRLTPEVKELTKKIMIENMDDIKSLQKSEENHYYKDFLRVMKVMTDSFDISEEDMIKIYTKCLNNGLHQSSILEALNKYIPNEEKDRFNEKIDKANIYPNLNYFWLTDEDLKRNRIDENKDNRNTIKSKIQADGRCFSIKVKTDMVGESKDGKKIEVNNLSKWLFGVPGARGNLTITKAGNYIQLPRNTPSEAIDLIEKVLLEREREDPSKS